MASRHITAGRFATLLFCLATGWLGRAAAQTTSLVSVATGGAQANADSGSNGQMSISGDGRYIVFASDATNLVPDDTNGKTDIFLRDTVTGTTRRVSVAMNGGNANGSSNAPVISTDGSYVAFESDATNLVAVDANNAGDIFLWSAATGKSALVSIAYDGAQAKKSCYRPSISANGRYVAFASASSNLAPDDTNNDTDVFVRDTGAGTTRQGSVASDGKERNNSSDYPAISGDGHFVAFQSSALLVPEDTGTSLDIYVHDMVGGATSRVSIASDGTSASSESRYPALSATGRYIVFQSAASNLVPGDTNGAWDVFIHDRETRTTARVSVGAGGAQSNSLSAHASVSADGRYVSFDSEASNLVDADPGGTDVFVHDRQTGATAAISVTRDGTRGANSIYGVLSADGKYIVFNSSSSNLVDGDTNRKWDVFTRGPLGVSPRDALMAAGGLLGLSASARADLDSDRSGRVDLLDAVTLTRRASGAAR